MQLSSLSLSILIPLISFICFCVHIICAFIILSDTTPIQSYLPSRIHSHIPKLIGRPLLLCMQYFVFVLVRYPFAGIPFRDLGCPPDARPSPPPIGWSTGFIATGRVRGLLPNHLDLPALPETNNW